MDGALQDHPGEVGLNGKAAVGAAGLVGAQHRVVHSLEALVLHVVLAEVIDGLELLAQGSKGLVLSLAPVLGLAAVEHAVIDRLRLLVAGLGQGLQAADRAVNLLHLVGQGGRLRELVLHH